MNYPSVQLVTDLETGFVPLALVPGQVVQVGSGHPMSMDVGPVNSYVGTEGHAEMGIGSIDAVQLKPTLRSAYGNMGPRTHGGMVVKSSTMSSN